MNLISQHAKATSDSGATKKKNTINLNYVNLLPKQLNQGYS